MINISKDPGHSTKPFTELFLPMKFYPWNPVITAQFKKSRSLKLKQKQVLTITSKKLNKKKPTPKNWRNKRKNKWLCNHSQLRRNKKFRIIKNLRLKKLPSNQKWVTKNKNRNIQRKTNWQQVHKKNKRKFLLRVTIYWLSMLIVWCERYRT